MHGNFTVGFMWLFFSVWSEKVDKFMISGQSHYNTV